MKNGILVVNKPKGVSSAAVVARLKRKLGAKKVGHTGTLDPFATGVLLIAVQKATRISRFFLDGSKHYLARVILGRETDTYDCTGQAVSDPDAEALAQITPEQVASVVSGFSGVQEQVAPAFSALKHQGQPLYKLARQGKFIQKPPRQIEIYHIRVGAMDLTLAGDPGQGEPKSLPWFDLEVHCSGGTYIRSLAYDIGKALGCGAHLGALARTRSGRFDIRSSADLFDLEAMSRESLENRMVTMADCLDFMPSVTPDGAAEKKIYYGQKLLTADLPLPQGQTCPDNFVRVVDGQGNLLAVIQPDKTGLTYNYCCVFTG